MAFPCKFCGIELDTEGGWKRHWTRMHFNQHGGYSSEDLHEAGIEPTGRDIARSVDAGNTSIDTVIENAPATEIEAKEQSKQTRQPRMSKEQRAQESDLAEFRRLRPQLVLRWKRRLRIPYSLWARLADDPKIALSETELDEGAEMHVDFCEAMGWLRAGKVEAIIDLTLWHGGTILSRSNFGQTLLNSFKTENPIDTGTDKR